MSGWLFRWQAAPHTANDEWLDGFGRKFVSRRAAQRWADERNEVTGGVGGFIGGPSSPFRYEVRKLPPS